MYVRIDVALSRQAVLDVIQERVETGESVTLDAIAAHIGCHYTTVWRAVRDLKRAGRIQLTQRGNPYMPTQYEILEDVDAECG